MAHPQLPSLLDPPARMQTGACDGDRPYVPWASGLSPDCRLMWHSSGSLLASYHHFVIQSEGRALHRPTCTKHTYTKVPVYTRKRDVANM